MSNPYILPNFLLQGDILNKFELCNTIRFIEDSCEFNAKTNRKKKNLRMRKRCIEQSKINAYCWNSWKGLNSQPLLEICDDIYRLM